MKLVDSGKSASTGHPRPERLAFTLDASTGEILKLESVDSAGHRREISKTERLALAKNGRGLGVESLLERAFEAGIACVLGDEDKDEDKKEDESETADEAGLRRILLEPLIEESFAAKTIQPAVLRQAIIKTLIQSSAESEGTSPKGHNSHRTGPKAST